MQPAKHSLPHHANPPPFPLHAVSTPISHAGSNDLDSKRSLSPPPRLELPQRVFRRESSRGAGAAEISSAFEEEDAELLQTEKSALEAIFGAPVAPGQATRGNQSAQGQAGGGDWGSQGQASAGGAQGSAAAASLPGDAQRRHGQSSGQVETQAQAAAAGSAASAPSPTGASLSPAPARASAPPAALAHMHSRDEGQPPTVGKMPAAQLAALAAAVPITPRFRFGCNILEQSPLLAEDRPSPSSEPGVRRASAPPVAGGGTGTGAGAEPGGAAARNGPTNSSMIGPAISAAAGGAPSQARATATAASSSSSTGHSGGGAAGRDEPCSDGGDAADGGAAPPPLVRDASPVRSRVSTDGSGGAGGVAAGGPSGAAGDPAGVGAVPGGARGGRGRSGHGAPMPPSGPKPPGPVPDMLRISQAAQALVSRAGMTTSTEALQAHAIAMFKRSTELQTGGIAWTRGELLGEGAFGKVSRRESEVDRTECEG